MARHASHCAVIFGARPRGLVEAAAARCAREGLPVYVGGGAADASSAAVEAVEALGGRASAVEVDLEDADTVRSVFERVERDGHVPALVLHAAGERWRRGFLDVTPELLETTWRNGCLSGFLVGQAAIRAMLPHKSGTLVFAGAAAALQGGPGDASYAAATAGLRIYAQAMAREFAPKGIHVAHVLLADAGGTRRDAPESHDDAAGAALDADAVADAVWDLHQQHKTAWSQELDLRSFVL